MSASTILRAPSGVLLNVSEDGHWWAIDGAIQVRLLDEPRAGLVFLEQPPGSAIVAAMDAGAEPFPLSALLQAGLAARSAYWVERALSWHEANQNLGSREEFASLAALTWLPQAVRHRVKKLDRSP